MYVRTHVLILYAGIAESEGSTAMTTSYSIDTAVRGYHIYRDVWQPVNGEVLQCERQTSNRHDPFAVAIKKNDVVVGHVPRRFSAICSLFLRRGGSITCTVNGSRRYSGDLPQGGLEIPCILTFYGESTKIDKVKDLTTQVAEHSGENKGGSEDTEIKNDVKSAETVIKTGDDSEESENKDSVVAVNVVWVNVGRITLTSEEKEIIAHGDELNDLHINAAQELIKGQFPSINGMHLTYLVAADHTSFNGWVPNYLQIFHCRGNHWVTVTTMGCENGGIYIFDSLYTDVDDLTKRKVEKLFSTPGIKFSVPHVQRQNGVKDCGLFAIAFATYLAFGNDPKLLTLRKFEQKRFRSHLMSCLEQNCIMEFP